MPYGTSGSALLRRCCAPLLLVSLAACDGLGNLLEVQPQDRVPAATVEDPARAELLVDGAIATFDCAFNAYVLVFGLITDELANAQSNVPFQSYDKRDISPSGGPSGIYSIGDCKLGGGTTVERFGLYKPVNSARWFTDDVVRQLEGWTDDQVPGRLGLLARTTVYSGFSHVLLGEGFCSAAIDGGPELTRDQVFERAEGIFARGIDLASQAGDTQMENAARVGRARVLLNLGRGAEAAAEAALVPEGFAELATASAASYLRYNRVAQFNELNFLVTVAPEFRGLTFAGEADPRVPVTAAGNMGQDGQTELWLQEKYDLDTGIPLATWEEAQLIIAEVEGGQEAVSIINALHDQADLPDFASTDEAEIQAHVREERRRELFLESHRIGDVVRLGLTLTPAAGAPFPGSLGGSYGTTTCLPLPDVERDANPNIP